MRFTNPLALLFLLLLPAVAAVGWPSRGYGRRREMASLALRLLITLCLVLALAGFSIARPSRDLAVVFLIDVSDSMPEAAQAAAVSYVRQAMNAMGPDDQAAVVVFGGDALVERPMSPGRDRLPLSGLASIPVTNATDLAEAMRLALALYPPGTARRMLILSDGADTASERVRVEDDVLSPGNPAELLDTARLAAASGVEVIVLPFVASAGPEVLISGVEAPHHLRQGERFDLRLRLQANQAGQVTIRVLEDDGRQSGKVVYEGSQELQRGSQSLSLPLAAGAPGFTRYQVQISSPGDTYYQNNEMAAYAQVEGPPKVLVVSPPAGEPLGFNAGTRPDESSALVAALQAGGYEVETVRPAELPADLASLAGYSSVVLVDVPARELSQRQMQAVQTYVRDLGSGLVVVGGPTSYGVGGYYRTPLEDTLPVEMQIKDQQRRPSLTIVFIIDHSGSMAETSGGATKLDLAKEAAIRSVELLSPMDRVGVITFDETASWVVPITDLSDAGKVINAIGTIRVGGGTDILAGVQAMANVLPGDPSRVKHVILLTDGGADPTGIPELVSRLNQENGITLSTVGIGRDSAPFLKDLAGLGGGRYHFAADPGSIPSIFTEETTLATRAYIVEEPFAPKLANTSPILAGIKEIPQLYGYVGTSPKEAAQTILVRESTLSGKGDPILAAWQYGLGKAVAFTSDATGRWAKDWVQWQGFPSFWAQAVRYTASPHTTSPLEVRVEPGGEGARLVVDGYQFAGASSEEPGSDPYLNGYTMQARVVDPGGKATDVELRQVAPGRYEGIFTPGQEGAYLIRVSGQAPGGGESVAETAGWVQSYSPEYRQLDSSPDTLARIAAAAGGRAAPERPGEIFAHTRVAPSASRPAWPLLLALAALLLPVDIGVRRLVLTRADLQRVRDALATRLARRLGTAPAQREYSLSEPSSRMGALMRSKERARQAQAAPPGAPPLVTPPAGTGASTMAAPGIPEASPAAKRETPEPVPAEAKKEQEARRPTTAAALLEQKRRRQEKREEEL